MALLKYEGYKFFRRKVMWLSFLAVPFLIALSYLYLSKNNITLSAIAPEDPSFASQISFPYLVIQEQLMLVFNGLVIFYTAIVITEERRSGELRQVIARGYTMWKVLASKMLLLAIVFFILFVECLGLSWIAGYLLMPKVDYAYTFFSYVPIRGLSALSYTIKYYGLAFLSVLGMLSLMTWVSILAKNKIITAGIGIGILIISMIYTQVISILYELGILRIDVLLYASIVQIQFTGIASVLGGIQGLTKDIAIVFAIYLIVFNVLAFWHERVSDYTD
ncbi:ABC transporter permease [Paenibacillus bouchesdurhonensis]|uniref:ABC transporter permease n=1 Tax=Paenibacillus bouchesdurhonensis TaxID=1870990 RepID=UPI0019024253|nr:ABC transporter permease [Paenibacillus bouchesdurhonensis]